MTRATGRWAAIALLCAAAHAHADPGWAVHPVGTLELDTIYDTTQGMDDVVGGEPIARPGTYAGDHGQTTFSARASRVGLSVVAPERGSVQTVGFLELDFLGSTPPGTSEQLVWQDPMPRLRQAYVLVTTPIVDVTVGQTWQLFGNQPVFLPATIAVQGILGEVYARSPQLRVAKNLALGDTFQLGLALAASRPPQRASATPDGQVSIALAVPSWRARHGVEGASYRQDALTLSVSGIARRFEVNNIAPVSTYDTERTGYGITASALLPLRDGAGDHAVTLIASIVSGAGISDLYQSLTNGVVNPPVAGYVANIDPDLAMWSVDGRSPSGYRLHTIQCESELLSVQYFPTPRIWFAGTVGHFHSGNAASFGPRSQVWNDEEFVDGSGFVELTPALRVGAGVSWFQQGYVDQVLARDLRLQGSAFLLF